MSLHLAVTGNIGAGKTTLTELLSHKLGWIPLFEAVDHNPYLEDFYKNMSKWSFALQIYFLGTRFRAVQEIQKSGKPSIQDRSLYEDAHIFARNLYEMRLLDQRDYDNYLSLFHLMESVVKIPDLMIYLRGEVKDLKKNIDKRGRDYEMNMSNDYLQRLNDRYEDWVFNHYQGKVMVLDIKEWNFLQNPINHRHKI